MVLLTVVLLTLAFAPMDEFYLAWIGLVPWLMVVRSSRSQWRVFLISWAAGTLFFIANMWWMYAITVPGMIALMVYLGFYWGVAALVIRGGRLLDPEEIRIMPARWRARWGMFGSIFSIAMVWTALEWVRGNLMTGLPWLYLGHTQTSWLAMCQIADTLGVYGVTFCVVLMNAVVALTISAPIRLRPRLAPAGMTVAAIVAANVGYGYWRMHQQTTYPGPDVLVLQSNYAQDNKNGSKGGTAQERIDFCFSHTIEALRELPAHSVNLVVWPETMLPALNHQAIDDYEATFPGRQNLALEARQRLSSMARRHDLGILTGAEFNAHFSDVQIGDNWYRIPSEKRNTAYFFPPDGTMSDAIGHRYDKIHLVPFGEFIPFKSSFPLLYDLFLKLGPDRYVDYELEDGSDNGLTVFDLPSPDGKTMWRFVTPICFEDIDSQLCAAMFRPGPDGRKRADFLVNITNDGWFAANENVQHLQAAVFRSIENRVPTARSVNTGVSGFIDSVGHVHRLLPPRTEGTSQMKLLLDTRLTFYTRFGDVFAWVCLSLSGLIVAASVAARVMKRTA